MDFKEPQLRMKDQGATRIVTVQIPIDGVFGQYVSASFEDAEQAGEANDQERERLIAKAKAVLAAASSAL